jgi:hypothetical protein
VGLGQGGPVGSGEGYPGQHGCGDYQGYAMRDFIMRVLRTFAMCPNDLCDSVWWRVDNEYAPITFFVNCNDLFWWATSDAEKITPENISVLEQSIAECGEHALEGVELFCCRVRKMRPQGCCYKKIPRELWPLFDAAGPERDQKELDMPFGDTKRPA